HDYYINIAAETGFIGLIAFLLFLMAIFVAGGDAYQIINQKYRQAKARQETSPEAVAPLGTMRKLSLIVHPIQLVRYYRRQETFEALGRLTNDRALAIGLLAALLTVCVHNLVDDLYVHSLTNLIALLLIALIRLAMVTPNRETSGGQG
ncbi:MAG TPA: hypothetical protein VFQ30_20450, partial [Ktedonobacteraceae bacterium]|nr:hypothetical protein [Ktedonobacteraceae bacterium]